MRIKRLHLKDFRCFDDFEINFSTDHNIHVIIAENMVGKTGILAALRLAANTYTSGLRSERQIAKTDHRIFGTNIISDLCPDIIIESTFLITNSKNAITETTFVKYKTKVEGERTKINIINGLDPRKESRKVNRYVGEGKAIQPLFGFIGTEYIHVESVETVPWNISGKSTDGYKGCFEDKSIKKFLFRWLGRMDSIIAEVIRKPILAEQYKDVPQNAVNVFQKAVTSILPDIQVIEWNADINQPIVKLSNGDVRQFDVLSDGYRYLILLAGELATRAFILNKHLGKDVLNQIHGMVIIDEFGIHLHPSLQNDALLNLQRTFPNVQFIISTHSPLLLNGLKKEQVHIVEMGENNKRITYNPDYDIVGMGANQILIDIFGLETTMDRQFLDWNLLYTKLYKKKTSGELSAKETVEFKELSKKLAPLRLDPDLPIVQEDPITTIVKEKLEKYYQESLKSNISQKDVDTLQQRIELILQDILRENDQVKL